MVSTKYHTEKSKTIRRLAEDAKPFKGREGEEGRGETTSTGGHGPEGVTAQVMLEVILTLLAAHDTRQ